MQPDTDGVEEGLLLAAVGDSREHQHRPVDQMNMSVCLEVLHERLCGRL